MKQYLVIIALGFLLVPQANAQPPVLIAVYNFDTAYVGTATSATGTVYRSYMNPLVLSSAGNFYQTGLTSVSGGYFATGHTPPANSRSRIGAGWPQTATLTKSVGFTVTPIAGQTLVIDRIDYWSARSNQGTDSTQWRTNVDSYAANSWRAVNTGNLFWEPHSITSGLPSSMSMIDIRFLTYHIVAFPNPAGTWRIDDVRVYGHLQDVFNLPIELLSFTRTAGERDVELSWSTATETNNDYFTIEKSYDMEIWEVVGTEPGAGTSLSRNDYSMRDQHPMPGWNYYRLSQTDLDGTHVIVATTEVLWRSRDGPTQVYSLDGRLIEDWSLEHRTLPRGQIYIFRDESGRAMKQFTP